MDTIPDIIETNRARLSGEVLTELKLSHKTYGEAFYETLLGIRRSSGYVDEIRVQISERLLSAEIAGRFEAEGGTDDDFSAENVLSIGAKLAVTGQVRTYNEEVGGRSKLNIVVFARSIDILDDEEECQHDNEIYLTGHICKKPIRRTSPLGREICDIMLAVNRMYNKSDYIPCIAWGRNAAYAGTLEVGDELIVTGRIQSREYRKRDEFGNSIPNVAYEVSIIKIEG